MPYERQKIEPSPFPLEFQRKTQKEEEEDIITSVSLKDGFAPFDGRVIIGLRTKGCSWARSQSGGCTHCKIPFSEICSPDSNNIFGQFIEDFSKYDFKEYPVLCLYTPGSFFDDDEISPFLRMQILEVISKEESIKRLSIESRPDFISERKIAIIREILPDIEIEVGLGLDSANEIVRNIFINKGFQFESYLEACEILNRFGIVVVTYILIKPPFLTESEAIIDGIRSAKKSFESGSSIVSFEPMSIQEGTTVYQLYKNGLYHPPWLWSVIEIVKEINSLGEIRISQFFYPPAVKYASNCERCNLETLQRIKEFNTWGDIKIFDKLKCECQIEWKKYVGNTEVKMSCYI